MRHAFIYASLLSTAALALQIPLNLTPLVEDKPAPIRSFTPPPTLSLPPYEGVGHLSEWSRASKKEFLEAVVENNSGDWLLVMGNEGGDTDSMVAAIAWAYHLTHLDSPQKAVALLQTEQDALDLRPENQLALHLARMSSGHRDLLTLDELPIKPFELQRRIKGVAVVDHNVPLSVWSRAPLLSIIDHHVDGGLNASASPRIIRPSASCTSLVAKEALDAEENGKHKDGHDPLPVELVELMLRAIALDSNGLEKSKSEDVDRESAERLWKRSGWYAKGKQESGGLKKTMKMLHKEMGKAKKNLGGLSVRDLLRRDWKGDTLKTSSPEYPILSLGFASIPYSLKEQILTTPEGTPPEFFAIERAWTSEIGADVSVCLNSFKHPKTGKKLREIVLVVAHGWGRRLSEPAAQDLFDTLYLAISSSPELELSPWHRPDGKELLPRRAVWVQKSRYAGRKVVRPVVERAAMEWDFGRVRET